MFCAYTIYELNDLYVTPNYNRSASTYDYSLDDASYDLNTEMNTLAFMLYAYNTTQEQLWKELRVVFYVEASDTYIPAQRCRDQS